MLDKFPSLNPKIEELYEFSKALYGGFAKHIPPEIYDTFTKLLFTDFEKFIAVSKLTQVNPNWVADAVLIVNRWYADNSDPMPSSQLVCELFSGLPDEFSKAFSRGSSQEDLKELLVDVLVDHGLIKLSTGSFNDYVLRFVHMNSVENPTNPYLEAEFRARATAVQRYEHERS